MNPEYPRPPEPPEQPSDEVPPSLNDAMMDFVSDPESMTVDVERQREVALRDVENEVETLRARRAELIESEQRGEDIDPELMERVGELLVDAEVRLHDLRGDTEARPE